MRTMTNIYKKGLLALICSLLLIGCNDFLDRENYSGIITPDKVWQNPKAIDAVMVRLYDGLRLDEFNDWYDADYKLMNQTTLSDEAQGSFQKDPLFDNANATYTYGDELFDDAISDRYTHIRRTNDFLKQLQTATVLSSDEQKILNAEARYIRVLHYFASVKRYGGVPLLTEPQIYIPGDVSSLYIARNTEEEVYSFIINECKEIATILPTTRDDAAKYRATSGAALALCSRAALYAGSIAKYGTVKKNGLVGIPVEKATSFFTESYNASKQILNEMVPSIYDLQRTSSTTVEDLSQNYSDIFTKSTNGNTKEYIFQKQYDVAGGKGHDWDKRNAPFSYRGGGWGCGMAPTLEMVEAYEYMDGSKGDLKIYDADGVTPRRFENTIDLFANKDPRLFASIYLPGSPCQNTHVEWMRGVIAPDGTKHQASDQPSGTNTVKINGVEYSTSGKDGGADVGDASKTGFYQKKFFDETLTDMEMGKSSTPWVVFRLAEIYLNHAEACMELTGKDNEALASVNEIRARAGMKKHQAISLEKVRHERRIELAFEKHRYWDMKRWRIAHKDVTAGGLTNFRGSALYPWFNVSDSKYTFSVGTKPPKQLRMFLDKNYYVKFRGKDLTTNPLMEQNPGYEN